MPPKIAPQRCNINTSCSICIKRAPASVVHNAAELSRRHLNNQAGTINALTHQSKPASSAHALRAGASMPVPACQVLLLQRATV